MAFISVFDVLGPKAISFLARKMIAPPIVKVEFTLYGSFAKTYQGHGTDRALLGGLMGFETDDTRIRNSFQIAQDRGLDYRFTPCTTETEVHPNTVDIRMENAAGQTMVVRGESLGGGKVRIVRINGVEVDFTGAYSTVIVVQQDKPGVVAHITKVAQRQRREHRLYAPVPGGQGPHGLHHRGVRRTPPGGGRRPPAEQPQRTGRHAAGAIGGGTHGL